MSWKIEVLAYGETNWVSNGLLFATKEAAEAYGIDLAGRWTGVKEHRAVEVDEPATYTWSHITHKAYRLVEDDGLPAA